MTTPAQGLADRSARLLASAWIAIASGLASMAVRIRGQLDLYGSDYFTLFDPYTHEINGWAIRVIAEGQVWNLTNLLILAGLLVFALRLSLGTSRMKTALLILAVTSLLTTAFDLWSLFGQLAGDSSLADTLQHFLWPAWSISLAVFALLLRNSLGRQHTPSGIVRTGPALDDTIGTLTKLKALLDAGTISEDDFLREKHKLLTGRAD